MSKKIVKADNWDGKSRPSNKAYDDGYGIESLVRKKLKN